MSVKEREMGLRADRGYHWLRRKQRLVQQLGKGGDPSSSRYLERGDAITSNQYVESR